MNVTETARSWRISEEVVRRYLREGRVPEATKDSRGRWEVPEGTKKPSVSTPKLADGERRELLRRARAGENRTHLAREYGINPSYVFRILSENTSENSLTLSTGVVYY